MLSKKIRVSYLLNSLESEVFQVFKAQERLNELSTLVGNFYLPYARLWQQENSGTKISQHLLEVTITNWLDLINNHLEWQQNRLDLIPANFLDSRVGQNDSSRKTVTISFSFTDSSPLDEVLKYLSNFSAKEINSKVRNLVVKWYLFSVRAQLLDVYSYKDLEFAHSISQSWLLNETTYLKNHANMSSPPLISPEIESEEVEEHGFVLASSDNEENEVEFDILRNGF